jgi:hypothetical protein
MPIKLEKAAFVNVDGLASDESINRSNSVRGRPRAAHQELSGGTMIHEHTCIFLCLLAVP